MCKTSLQTKKRFHGETESLRKYHRQDQFNSEAKPEQNHISKPIEARIAYKVETFG